MFRDDNEEFMKSFEIKSCENIQGDIFVSPVIPKPIIQKKKICEYIENTGFNMVSEELEEKSISFGDKEERQKESSKKINYIKQSMFSSRKFSDSNIKTSVRKEHNFIDEKHSDESCSISQKKQMPDFIENQPPEEDIQTYYMKKIRIFQAKFKKVNFYYETQVMQLKKNNNLIEQKLKLYEEAIDQYNPTLKEEIQEQLNKKQEEMSFLSSSSNSNSEHINDIAMPVISQMIEVKIQGKKLCDIVKELSTKNKQLQKIISSIKSNNQCLSHSVSLIPKKNNNPEASMPKKNLQERKYSIQAMQYRHKKQSFQTTIISGGEKTNPSKGQLSTIKTCKECTILKSYLSRFQQKLNKISKIQIS